VWLRFLAKLHFSKLVTDHEITVQSFQAYGSNYIKKAGYSPDAYVQVAMQLATYRLWGKQAGTYEATQVRPFLHGRTETTRSVSLEGEAFVKQMGVRPKHDENDESIRSKKLELLHNAVTSHVKYIGNAAKAMGVDRHFFGLSMMVADGENVPSLYSHPLFVRSKRWRVSTSHLTHPKFDNWGYGEVYPDGVGLSYAIKADSCVFSITALKENGWTDRLSHLLEEALMEMRTLNDLNKPLVSKL
jgi:carnitine O-acetyltransferase